ncbi:hypothetical protein DKX38_024929 [Salix brachista]|uniref:Anthocyanidin 3-O-glucosyltransferase n=1 Tax=Salix brachista TaxID=2182728 RepID=A0A5N5JT07_9ROSI|nr:hypothetical protein DKX38_024929 [Salix brachista]
MNSVGMESTAVCHVVAMPFPGRGHINPMMNFCKLLASRKHDILITFVVTEEWLGYIGSEPRPDSVRLVTIPNVIPPESLKAVDFPGFYEAVMTKMEAPFEQLLDQIEIPVTAIIGDIEVRWAISLGSRRNIPVAAFWTMSATFLSMLYHFNLFNQNQKSPTNLLGQVDYIPGISSSDLAELQKVFQKTDQRVFQLALECISKVPQAQYLLFTSIYELEPQVMDTMKDTFQFPVYPIGPAIPYLELEGNFSGTNDSHMVPDYLQWLDCQPKGSVLYISLGSFLSVSSTQMDEIFAGLQDSGVRFLWVARGEASRLKDTWSDDRGLVLPWCDQLKVLCHSSIDGFWTHCGWNSTLEAVFAGVPMLTFPLFLDQDPNSKQILEDWRIGREVRRDKVRTLPQLTIHLHSEFQSMAMNHVVAMPYPGRGHINPMMNLCKQLVSKNDTILITFIVTEEWFGLIGSDPNKPDRIRFATIPNVIPSEMVRSKDLIGFMEAVATKMGAPFERLLDQLEPPAPSLIVTDTFLLWAFDAGNQRNIPVASFWPLSAMAFSVFYHFDRFLENGHYPVNFQGAFFCLESSHERVNYIPGVNAMSLMDLPPPMMATNQDILKKKFKKMFSWVPKVQYFLLPTTYELESQVIDTLKRNLSKQIYPIGPAIPYFDLGDSSTTFASDDDVNYLRWLDCQPCGSVLYVSLGSFLSVSSAQMDEIAAGLSESGVRFLWVARGETERLSKVCGGKGLMARWCDQLRVLCHPSVGGFLSHCGWNSICEGVFAGLPFLTFPIVVDQFPNCKLIVEDWKIGLRVKEFMVENLAYLVTKEEISGLVTRFMDLESNEVKEMRRRAKELQGICQYSTSKGGSSETNINSFIRDILLSNSH